MIAPIKTIDYHTGGEPFRIVVDHGLDIPGSTVAERRMFAIDSPEVDGLRKILCFEPRGHADMYGGFLTPPDDDGAHFGVLFWHKDGFSTACGHGTIALGVWAIESGLVQPDPSGITNVVIDVPSGRVTARVHTDAEGQVGEVDFDNVASYLLHTEVPVSTSRGDFTVDVAFGGAIYAMLDVAKAGLEVTPENVGEIIAIGREIKWLLNDTEFAQHPTDPRLSDIYGTIVYENLGTDDQGRVWQRNATIFADGELDRSPCGSGTCARIATLTAQGVVPFGEVLTHDSIVSSRFEARALEQVTEAGYEAISPRVTGHAYKTGESTFTVDPRDPQVPGFVLR